MPESLAPRPCIGHMPRDLSSQELRARARSLSLSLSLTHTPIAARALGEEANNCRPVPRPKLVKFCLALLRWETKNRRKCAQPRPPRRPRRPYTPYTPYTPPPATCHPLHPILRNPSPEVPVLTGGGIGERKVVCVRREDAVDLSGVHHEPNVLHITHPLSLSHTHKHTHTHTDWIG
jgi:hypothetical protein